MRKILVICLFLLLTACESTPPSLHDCTEDLCGQIIDSKATAPQNTEAPLEQEYIAPIPEDYYVSEKFGIKFKKSGVYDSFAKKHEVEFRESENGMGFERFGDRIKIYYKEEDQDIKSAILELIANEGKNPDDCFVISPKPTNPEGNRYLRILLADEVNIDYTDEELTRIAKADIKSDNGPFNGEWMKMKIHNERLIELCTEHADPAGLGTSKSIASMFIYNEHIAKDRFVFTEDSYEVEFYEWDSIEFLD